MLSLQTISDSFILEYETRDPAGARFGLRLRPELEPGINLLGLATPPDSWRTWTGEHQSAVKFEYWDHLRIQAPTSGHFSEAVMRYNVFPSFEAGRPYDLLVSYSYNPGCSTSLFFFDEQYRIIQVDGADWVQVIAERPWPDATARGERRFTWPAHVAYFVLQVQGRWNAHSVDMMRPMLAEAS